jgi:hypothetical protein
MELSQQASKAFAPKIFAKFFSLETSNHMAREDMFVSVWLGGRAGLKRGVV